MTRLYNIVVPKFLRDFDEYLLRNYPVVWRTKAAFVLFYGLIAIPFLFSAGFIYTHFTINAQNLAIESKMPIYLGYDFNNIYCILFAFLGIFFWAYKNTN